MIIAILNQKGGVGKTTTSVHLAYWLKNTQNKSTILIDTDPQKSSLTWANFLEIPTTTITDPDGLFDEIENLEQTQDYIVIDGPAGVNDLTKTALYLCDLALIPCQPSGLDIHSTDTMSKLVKQARKVRDKGPKAYIFLNAAKKNTLLLKEAIQFFTDTSTEAPLLDTIIYHRQCISDAPGQKSTVFTLDNKPAKDASEEFKNLFSKLLTNYEQNC